MDSQMIFGKERVSFMMRKRTAATLAGAGVAAFLLQRRLGALDDAAWVHLLFRPTVRWAAHQVLPGRNRSRRQPERGRFTHADVDSILVETWHRYVELAPAAPEEPTLGSRMNVHLAVLSLACFQTLRAHGAEQPYAIELFADMAWAIYAQWGRIPDSVARLLAQTPLQRLRLDVAAFLRFPFNPPGYAIERLADGEGVAFNVRRCPIAEYFQAHGAADLCVASWCNLDYALAEMWGGHLERSGTLANGDAFCDFRFVTGPDTSAPALREGVYEPSASIRLPQGAETAQEVESVHLNQAPATTPNQNVV